MDTILLLLSIAIIIILIILILLSVKNSGNETDLRELADMIKKDSTSSDRELRAEISSNIQTSVNSLGSMLNMNQKNSGEAQSKRIDDMSSQISSKLADMDKFLSQKQEASGNAINEQLKMLENRFKTLEANNEMKLEAIRSTMTKHLTSMQDENSKKLDAIQTTVNEKLESKMNESFKLVSDRLEQVYKGLGEMQSIASGVGDLKKVLSNVKNRGIIGEIQLGAILEDILSPEQYEREAAVVPRSSNRVEFAVKLPGNGEGSFVYLPIDSKFPGDTFAALQDAYDSSNAEAVSEAKKQLKAVIKKCAKDISDKYISPPYTTNFGIMFLPFEGLYAEVVNSGLIETLQHDYNVNVTGPSTMAAMLNSLQMGFQTLAIQKKSSQVWEILGAVKTEFQSFAKVLEDTQKHIKKVDDDLEKLVGVRTRQINRKLSSIDAIGTSDLSVDEDEQ